MSLEGMAIKTIGFIGVGTMGRGMASNLAKNGFKVIAFNRSRQKIADLGSDGMRIADSLEEALKADAVITCLPSDDAVRSVYFKQGFLGSLMGKIALDCGTTSLELTQEIANACKKEGVEFLDSPITGSKLAALGGTLTFMVGGKKELFERCEPIYKAMGKTWVHCGPITYGQRAKIALNMTQSLILESYLEGIVFARKMGVPLQAIVDVMENSGAKSGVGLFKLPYIRKGDFEAHFRLNLMHKDLMFADREMKKLGLSLPLAKEILSVFGEAMDRGHEDIATIAKTLEKKYGTELRD